MKRNLPSAVGLIAHENNREFFKKLSQKQHEWIAAHYKPGRIFSFNGKYAMVPKFGRAIPYGEITGDLIYTAQSLLDKNPPFYLDVETHFSGVDVVKLESNKKYDCKVMAEITGGGTPPYGGIYDAKASSLIISLLEYKCCFEEAKKDGDKKLADEFARCYTALLDSQEKETFLEKAVFYFGDAI
jgi:hypothetical protein